MIEWGCLAMSLSAVGLSIIEVMPLAEFYLIMHWKYDLEFSHTHENWALLLLHLVFVFSLMHGSLLPKLSHSMILLAILTVVRYQFQLQFNKTRGLISQKETIFTTGQYIPLMIEVLLIMVIPNPWLYGYNQLKFQLITYAFDAFRSAHLYSYSLWRSVNLLPCQWDPSVVLTAETYRDGKSDPT